jgi:hypothetical protein
MVVRSEHGRWLRRHGSCRCRSGQSTERCCLVQSKDRRRRAKRVELCEPRALPRTQKWRRPCREAARPRHGGGRSGANCGRQVRARTELRDSGRRANLPVGAGGKHLPMAGDAGRALPDTSTEGQALEIEPRRRGLFSAQWFGMRADRPLASFCKNALSTALVGASQPAHQQTDRHRPTLPRQIPKTASIMAVRPGRCFATGRAARCRISSPADHRATVSASHNLLHHELMRDERQKASGHDSAKLLDDGASMNQRDSWFVSLACTEIEGELTFGEYSSDVDSLRW